MSPLPLWDDLVLRDPQALWLGIVLAGVLLLRAWRGRAAATFGPASLLAGGLGTHGRVWLLPLPPLLVLLAALLAVIALARPAQRVPLPLTYEGIDVVLCVDVSSSMAAHDMDPQRSRLEVVQQAAADFVARRPDDRIGLVAFARYPDLLCPPTQDHRALGSFLAALERVPPDGDEDLTGIGTAVARAAQVLERDVAPSKVVVLLTDGAENVATAQTRNEIGPLLAAQLCQEFGVRVYTIVAGIGERDREGTWVPLDTGQVQQLAERTGGAFFAAPDAAAMDRVYTTIDALERAPLAEPRYTLRDRFVPFLLAALAAWLLGRVLASTVLRVLP